MVGVTQFSLFGAEAAVPSSDDLDGLLLAGALWVRSPAGTRLSIVVDDRWRAEVLAEAFAERGLDGEGGAYGSDAIVEAPGTGGFAVRTAFTAALAPAAARWTRGANHVPPANLAMGAGALRLWTIATGRPDDVGYLLATADADGPTHRVAGAQLARLGVAAVALTHRGGPGWRVTSSRRLRRLVELVGAAPPGGAASWPTPPAGR